MKTSAPGTPAFVTGLIGWRSWQPMGSFVKRSH